MINGDSNLREFGRFRLDVRTRVLWCGDEPVNLPLKQIELLCVLTEKAGEVITKNEILDKIWADSFVEESNLTRHIYMLRRTLKDHGESDGLIQTVPRRGYRFTGEVRDAEIGDLVFERHTSTRTMIEVSDDAPSDNERTGVDGSLATLTAKARARPFLTAAVLVASIIAVGFVLSFTLDRIGTSAASAQIRSIAVLPVRSFSETPDDEELRLRIADALITRLGTLGHIAVRPTSAILPFAGSDEDGLSIGKRLHADAVIDSRLQRENDRVRVTIQMIRTADGANLWSDQFDGNADQILDLQDRIFAKVSQTLDGAGARLPEKGPTQNAEAYEAYLKGRFFWNKRDAESLRKATEYFTLAGDLDPQFSEAFSGLADTQHLLFNYNIDVRPEIVAEAKANLRRALELDPNSADALVTLGTIEMGYDWDWAAAENSLSRAVATAPNSPTAHMRYGALLVRTRKFDEAIAAFQRQVELDPLSLTGLTNLGMARFCAKDYPAAENEFQSVLDLDPKSGTARWLLSRNMWMQGRKEEAVTEIARALELDGNMPMAEKVRKKNLIASPVEAIKLLLHEWRENPPGTNPHNLAYLSVYVGDKERAIYWLERSIGEHHPWTTWIAAAPEFEKLRGDSRYEEMLRRLNLP